MVHDTGFTENFKCQNDSAQLSLLPTSPVYGISATIADSSAIRQKEADKIFEE